MTTLYVLFNIVVVIILTKVIWDHFHKKEEKVHSPTPQEIISTSTPKEGVRVDILMIGNGPPAVSGKLVKVHYTAWLTNGQKVDSSFDKGEPFKFTLGRRKVIPGWEAGMLGMKEGEKRKFTIAPSQAYGAKGKANVPGNATIVFEVELLKVY
jgi:FKBP-type peptidyl-prolyl cis-trans isomerase